jgi:hypothetical protein
MERQAKNRAGAFESGYGAGKEWGFSPASTRTTGSKKKRGVLYCPPTPFGGTFLPPPLKNGKTWCSVWLKSSKNGAHGTQIVQDSL